MESDCFKGKKKKKRNTEEQTKRKKGLTCDYHSFIDISTSNNSMKDI